MDDLNSVISSILGDPQKMEQLRNVAQSLGMNPGGPAPGNGPNFMNQQPPDPGQAQTPPPNMNMGGGMNNGNPMNGGNPMNNMGMNDQGGGNNMNGMNGNMNSGGQQGNSQGGGFNLGSISKLAGMLGGVGNSNDKNVQLLRALQPHISSGRAGRIDDAVRIMQLMSAWPAIRDSGLLGSLGNLFSGGGHK